MATAPSGPSLTPSTSSASPALLLVEDEPSVAETLAAILEAEGYRVEVAARVADALAWVRATPFDAALLDVQVEQRRVERRRAHPREGVGDSGGDLDPVAFGLEDRGERLGDARLVLDQQQRRAGGGGRGGQARAGRSGRHRLRVLGDWGRGRRPGRSAPSDAPLGGPADQGAAGRRMGDGRPTAAPN